jgi:predicted hotdog family 3-hydroxylacyl-ACP dehydratase
MTSDIEAYVPHRGMMRLLDRVVAVNEEQALAEVDVPDDGLFVQDGAVPAWVGVEYMAQAAAVWAGARAIREGRTPGMGFLLGSRRYESRVTAFPGGATLRVQARCELVDDKGMGVFDCSIALDGDVVATARLSVFEPRDAGALTENGMPA